MALLAQRERGLARGVGAADDDRGVPRSKSSPLHVDGVCGAGPLVLGEPGNGQPTVLDAEREDHAAGHQLLAAFSGDDVKPVALAECDGTARHHHVTPNFSA